MKIWSVADGRLISRFEAAESIVNVLSLKHADLPEGRYLVSLSYVYRKEGNVKLWDAPEGRLCAEATLNVGSLTSMRRQALAATLDGSLVAGVGGSSDDGTIKVWKTADLLKEPR